MERIINRGLKIIFKVKKKKLCVNKNSKFWVLDLYERCMKKDDRISNDLINK